MASTIVSGSIIFLVFFGHICAKTTPQSSFENVLEDVSSCKESCERTYPDHTYEEKSHLPACQRGCRLFSILEYAEDDLEDFNTTKELCKEACLEAYNSTGLLQACNLGCQNEVPFAFQKRQEWQAKESSFHILTPILAIQTMCDKFSEMANFRFSSWLVYMKGDNGELYIFESQPEIDIFTLDPEFDFDQAAIDVQETNLEVLNGHDSTDYPQHNWAFANDNDNYNWLDCVSKKSGLPRWLLAVTLLLSAVAMIWLCCVTTATAPDHHVSSSQKVAIYNDLAYLKNDKKDFIHPVLIKSLPGPDAVSVDDDDVPLLLLHVDARPPQTKI